MVIYNKLTDWMIDWMIDWWLIHLSVCLGFDERPVRHQYIKPEYSSEQTKPSERKVKIHKKHLNWPLWFPYPQQTLYFVQSEQHVSLCTRN